MSSWEAVQVCNWKTLLGTHQLPLSPGHIWSWSREPDVPEGRGYVAQVCLMMMWSRLGSGAWLRCALLLGHGHPLEVSTLPFG